MLTRILCLRWKGNEVANLSLHMCFVSYSFFLALGLRYAIYSYWYNRSVRLHLSIPLHLLIASILFPARHDHLQFRITRE